MKQASKWKCGSYEVMLPRSSFKGELQPSCGEQGNPKAFSCQHLQGRPLLHRIFLPKVPSFPGSSHLAVYQDGGIMAQPFCSCPRQTRTSSVPPEICFLLLLNRLPQIWQLKTTTYYLIVLQVRSRYSVSHSAGSLLQDSRN